MSLKEQLQIREISPSTLEKVVTKDAVLYERFNAQKKNILFAGISIFISSFIIASFVKNDAAYIIADNRTNNPVVHSGSSIVVVDAPLVQEMIEESAIKNQQVNEKISELRKLNHTYLHGSQEQYEKQQQAALEKHKKEIQQYVEMSQQLLQKTAK